MTSESDQVERPAARSLRIGSASLLRYRWLFAVSFALLICHELDAMIRQEWDLFPLLSSLSDDTAADVFNLLHIILFGIPIWLLTSDDRQKRAMTMLVVEFFAIAHATAHASLRGVDDYQFEPPIETLTVFGSAAFALAHILTARPWQVDER